MRCPHTLAYGMNVLDGATRQKHRMLKDDKGYLVVDLYPAGKLVVGPNAIFGTWAKCNAPAASSTVVTVIIQRTNEPFEDMPITP